MIKQQRSLSRPAGGTVRLEHDRREQLNPVGNKLPVAGLTQLAALSIDTKPAGSITSNP
jgi:hypothetical protein